MNAQLKRLPQLCGLAGQKLYAFAFLAHRDQPNFTLFYPFNDLVRPNVISPDNGGAIFVDDFVEQPHLGFEIAVHRAVIIEMVPAQIGERCDGYRDTFTAILRKAMAGGLKYGVGHTFAR